MSGTDYNLTPKLGLFKPITNMDSNNWGTHWNANADQLDRSVIYDAKGNVGISVLPPANQSAPNASGGWIFGWGLTANNWATNGYYDGTSWRYLAAGTFWQTQQTGAATIWQYAASGAKDAVATPVNKMTLDGASGNLSLAGAMYVREVFRATGSYPQLDLYSETAPTDNRMAQIYVEQSNGSLNMQFTNDAANTGGPIFSATRSGNTTTALNLTATIINLYGEVIGTGNIFANGGIFPAASTMGNGFALFVDANYEYIRFTVDNWMLAFTRSNGTLFYAHSNGTNLWSVDGAGNTWAPGQVASGGILHSLGGRVLAERSGNTLATVPALAAYNPSVASCQAWWVNGAGAWQWGAADGAGTPAGVQGYLSATTIGFAGWDCSVAVSSGGYSLCWGNGNTFNVPGAAWKPGGGYWADSSDIRTKDVLGEYVNGLDAILALRPVRYKFRGNWNREGAPQNAHREAAELGTVYVGLVAQEAEVPMPEMVTSIDAKLDDIEVKDLRILDMTALPLALVNAVKTLAARVAALETKPIGGA